MTAPPGDLDALLRGVAGWLAARERAPGELVCEKHRIEHTGKSAYLAMLDALAPEPDLERAARVARRVAGRVAEDPKEAYGAWIVLPGSRDPHNHSTNAIDCGGAIDALATLGRLHGARLAAPDRDAIETAVRRCASTYLVPHAMPKEILAQRLWSLAALGSAYAWLGDPAWKVAGLAAIDRSLGQQNPDGSFPYTPRGTPRSHEGSSDASAFYHSRHALFVAHALRSFGEDPAREPYAPRLRAASEFLLALRRADGTKTPFVEAKPWYWESSYEVAGFPWDVASLAACGRALGEPRYLAAAREMLALLMLHVEPDGGVTSHRGPGWSFQCRFFWNAHCAWLARARGDLAGAGAAAPSAAEPEIGWFPDAGVARFADDRIVAIVRGAKPRSNVHHGSPFGGGGLLHAASRAAPAAELVGKRAGDAHPAGEWRVFPRGAPGLASRLRRAWRENREELRFSAWVARVRARSGDRAGAARWWLEQVRRGLFGASRAGYSSGTATRVEAAAARNSVAFRGTVADPFGEPVEGVATIRRYVFEPGTIRVGDALVAERPLRSVHYRLPDGARDAAYDGAPAVVRRGIVRFGRVPRGTTLAIRYRIAADGAPAARA